MNKLHILWTTDNLITSEHMVFMYATKSLEKKTWDEITIIIWGASTLLAANNKVIQELIQDAILKGVKVSACIACATQLNVVESLRRQGLEVIAWGPLLTKIIQNKEPLITI